MATLVAFGRPVVGDVAARDDRAVQASTDRARFSRRAHGRSLTLVLIQFTSKLSDIAIYRTCKLYPKRV